MIIESIYYRFFSFYYEYIMKILNYDRIKKKVTDVFGLAQADLHVFKMKRLIGKVKNESFICISLVASFPRRALARLPHSCSSDDDPSRQPRLTKRNNCGITAVLSSIPSCQVASICPFPLFPQPGFLCSSSSGVASWWMGKEELPLFIQLVCSFLVGPGDPASTPPSNPLFSHARNADVCLFHAGLSCIQ